MGLVRRDDCSCRDNDKWLSCWTAKCNVRVSIIDIIDARKSLIWRSWQNNSAFRKFCCHLLILTSGWPEITGLAGAWEALFAYDSLIFSLTIYKTWKVRQDYVITGVEIPLITLILRDGEIQFEYPRFPELIFLVIGAIYFSWEPFSCLLSFTGM